MKILITPKINPDLDGLACAYAYSKLLNVVDQDNEYVAGIFGQPHIEARFLLGKLGIKDTLHFNPETNFAKFIIVDASDLKGMPKIIRPEDVIEVVDHRIVHQAGKIFINAQINIELLGAAATLIFEKYQTQKIDFDYSSALLLYGAIFSNTLNFQVDIAGFRDREAVRALSEKFNMPVDIINEMFQYKTDYSEDNLVESIRDDSKTFNLKTGQKISIAQIEGFDLENIFRLKEKEIGSALRELKAAAELDIIFLNLVDIKNGFNIIVTIDDESRLLLSDKLGLKFIGNISRTDQLWLRKQIMPILMN